jgi:hypothetical protein
VKRKEEEERLETHKKRKEEKEKSSGRKIRILRVLKNGGEVHGNRAVFKTTNGFH